MQLSPFPCHLVHLRSKYYLPIYVLVSLMASFPQASPPTPCAHLYSPPYTPHALPISFVSILPPAQYWVRSTDHAPNDCSTKLMIWRWTPQNTFGMWIMLYWTRSSRTQFSVSIDVWRLLGHTWNITRNFLYCNHQVHRDFLITLYIYNIRFLFILTETDIMDYLLISARFWVNVVNSVLKHFHFEYLHFCHIPKNVVVWIILFLLLHQKYSSLSTVISVTTLKKVWFWMVSCLLQPQEGFILTWICLTRGYYI
jgi:hypothetical protein